MFFQSCKIFVKIFTSPGTIPLSILFNVVKKWIGGFYFASDKKGKITHSGQVECCTVALYDCYIPDTVLERRCLSFHQVVQSMMQHGHMG